MNHRDFHSTGDPAWINQTRALLDDSVRDLDAATLSRLNRARQIALEQQRRPRPARVWLLPAGLASACALLLAVAVWQPHRHAESSPMSGVSGTTSARAGTGDALSDEASLEFYQDLEFYAWLDAQNKDGG